MRFSKHFIILSALLCVVAYQNCTQMKASQLSSPSLTPGTVESTFDMSALDHQKFQLTEYYDGQGSQVSKVPYVYATEILQQNVLGQPGSYLSFEEPAADCNSHSLLCSPDQAGIYQCVGTSTQMGCSDTYDLSDYFLIPARFVLRKNSAPDHFEIWDAFDNSHAVFRIFKAGETVPVNATPPLAN